MSNIQFLRAAQDYAASRNEEYWFAEAYTRYREFIGVRESANAALHSLYGTDCHLVEGFD